MNTSSIRQKLVDYLQVADDKKVEAIYSILEEEVEANTINWNDKHFVNELDKRTEEYKNGTIKVQSWEDAKAQVLGSIQNHNQNQRGEIYPENPPESNKSIRRCYIMVREPLGRIGQPILCSSKQTGARNSASPH